MDGDKNGRPSWPPRPEDEGDSVCVSCLWQHGSTPQPQTSGPGGGIAEFHSSGKRGEAPAERRAMQQHGLASRASRPITNGLV